MNAAALVELEIKYYYTRLGLDHDVPPGYTYCQKCWNDILGKFNCYFPLCNGLPRDE